MQNTQSGLNKLPSALFFRVVERPLIAPLRSPVTGFHRTQYVSSSLLHETELLSSSSEQQASESVSQSWKNKYISIDGGIVPVATFSNQKRGHSF